MTIKRTAVLVCIAIPLGLVAAGCGSQSPTGTTSASSASSDQAPFRYAQCMREHGVSGFPDPHVSTTDGGTKVSQMVPSSLAASPKFKSASRACAGIEPGPGSGGGAHSGPSKPDLLAFASCLRRRGISGFPDPTAQGRLNIPMITAAGVDYHSREFRLAADSCVGVTHGAITAAQVAALVSGTH